MRPLRSTSPRRTPCVGICSTTYGDLVCRGCKRFSHEITGWNTYSAAQRQDVEARLVRLQAGVISGLLEVLDEAQCETLLAADAHTVAARQADAALDRPLVLRVYGYLTRARTDAEVMAMAALPIRLAGHLSGIADLRDAVEAEFLSRSKAAYERSFKVSVE